MSKQIKQIVNNNSLIDLTEFKSNSIDKSLKEKYMVIPFTVLDSKTGEWQKRKREWKSLGIKSEIGRNVNMLDPLNKSFANEKYGKKEQEGESIFDPVLCEILYHWYCPEKGSILDPFSGGSVRGIVSNFLEYDYTGIDIRSEQIESNIEQAKKIVPENMPSWIVGDSNKILDSLFFCQYDMIFSCPPYANLEVYSDLEFDISNMNYSNFLIFYRSIINKSSKLLKIGGYAVFVVGEIRDKKTGELMSFVNDTITAFKDAGLIYYNEAILLNMIGTSMLRIGTSFERGKGKLVSIHQNILIFKKIN